MPKIKPHLKNLYRFTADRRIGEKILRLDMNESVSGLPKYFIKEVLSKIGPDFLAAYPDYRVIQNKIAGHNKLKPDNICLSNGSDAAIKYIFDAYISPQDKVLLTNPTFAMYPVYCSMFNAQPVIIDYKADLSFPLQKFIDNLSRDIKMAVVVEPNNPTGSILGQSGLMKIIKKAADSDTLLIVDEAYFYFYPRTVIQYVKKYKNLVVLRTFSKLCGMASARLGYAAACPDIIGNLRRVKPTFDVNGIGVLIAKELLDRPDIIAGLIKDTEAGKKFLIKKLTEGNIEYKKGYANFVLIKCNNRVEEIKKGLFGKGILVAGGFKQDFLKDYIRVNVGDKKNMQRFWKSFISIWKESRK